MRLSPEDDALLEQWAESRLRQYQLTNAESIASLTISLLKHDVDDLYEHCREELQSLLREHNAEYIAALFQAIDDGSFRYLGEDEVEDEYNRRESSSGRMRGSHDSPGGSDGEDSYERQRRRFRRRDSEASDAGGGSVPASASKAQPASNGASEEKVVSQNLSNRRDWKEDSRQNSNDQQPMNSRQNSDIRQGGDRRIDYRNSNQRDGGSRSNGPRNNNNGGNGYRRQDGDFRAPHSDGYADSNMGFQSSAMPGYFPPQPVGFGGWGGVDPNGGFMAPPFPGQNPYFYGGFPPQMVAGPYGMVPAGPAGMYPPGPMMGYNFGAQQAPPSVASTGYSHPSSYPEGHGKDAKAPSNNEETYDKDVRDESDKGDVKPAIGPSYEEELLHQYSGDAASAPSVQFGGAPISAEGGPQSYDYGGGNFPGNYHYPAAGNTNPTGYPNYNMNHGKFASSMNQSQKQPHNSGNYRNHNNNSNNHSNRVERESNKSNRQAVKNLPENERCTLRCTSIPVTVTEEELRAHFESFGHVVELQISPMEQNNNNHGNNGDGEEGDEKKKKPSNECLVQFYSASNARKCLTSATPVLSNRFIFIYQSHFNIVPPQDVPKPSRDILERDAYLMSQREIIPGIAASHATGGRKRGLNIYTSGGPNANKWRRTEDGGKTPAMTPKAPSIAGDTEEFLEEDAEGSARPKATAAVVPPTAESLEKAAASRAAAEELKQSLLRQKQLKQQADELLKKKEEVLQSQVEKCRAMMEKLEASPDSDNKAKLLQNLESKIVDLQSQLRTVREQILGSSSSGAPGGPGAEKISPAGKFPTSYTGGRGGGGYYGGGRGYYQNSYGGGGGGRFYGGRGGGGRSGFVPGPRPAAANSGFLTNNPFAVKSADQDSKDAQVHEESGGGEYNGEEQGQGHDMESS